MNAHPSHEWPALYRMLTAAEKAAGFVIQRQRADLDTDELLVLALTHLIEIIGESAHGISPAFQKDNPHIPWQQLIKTRNDFIHAYFDVDHDMVWDILHADLPPLISALKKIIEEE